MQPETLSELERKATQARRQIYSALKLRSPGRYDKIISYMEHSAMAFLLHFMSLSKAKLSARVLTNTYAGMRGIDEIVDGDAPLPAAYDSSKSYIQDRSDFLNSYPATIPSEPVDSILAYVLELSNDLDYDIKPYIGAIIKSMLFDAKRFGTSTAPPNRELEQHYYLQDIYGTIGAMLIIFGLNPERRSELRELGVANRISLTLPDFAEDLRKGLVNVSAEDCARYGITAQILRDCADGSKHPAVKGWMHDKSTYGLNLVEKHRQKMASSKFPPVTSVILSQQYEKQTVRVLSEFINTAG